MSCAGFELGCRERVGERRVRVGGRGIALGSVELGDGGAGVVAREGRCKMELGRRGQLRGLEEPLLARGG